MESVRKRSGSCGPPLSTFASSSSSTTSSPPSSLSSSSSASSSLRSYVDPAKQAYNQHQYAKCAELLRKLMVETNVDIEKRRLDANLALCEARNKSELFQSNYQIALLRIFPQLKSGEEYKLENYDEAVAAFNLALNAFVRGNRRTGLELLQAVMTVKNLPDSLICAASLLEIEMSLTLCQPKIALKQSVKLRDSPIWRHASFVQRDLLDCLEFRIRCRLAQTSPFVDFSTKPESLQWCLVQSELDMRNGNAMRAVNRLLKFRPSVQDEERRLIDNALGCIYALSLKKTSLAESYFRSAMFVNKNKRKSWQESAISRHCLIYHAALAQLHCGQAESAFTLFLAVLPFYRKQPRIWLRIAECCICSLTKNGNNCADSNGRLLQIIGTMQSEYVIPPNAFNLRLNR